MVQSFCLVALLAGMVTPFFASAHCSAQTPTESGAHRSVVILTRLSAPIYPPIALSARVTGDVELQLEIRPDGSVESAVVSSGPLLLQDAALESAKRSQFECRWCNQELMPYRLLYTFQLDVREVRCDAPKDCGKSAPIEHAPKVTQSQNHVILVNQVAPECICDAIRKVRSLKCLYLWRCGLHS